MKPYGRVAEWLKAADCKSAGVRLRRFESYPFHHYQVLRRYKFKMPVYVQYTLFLTH